VTRWPGLRSAWLFARHALAELLGKRNNNALRPADVG
jgi:hypothetical protein